MQHTQQRFDYTYYKKLLMMILAVAFPAIVEMALNTMLMVADTVMVSRMVGRDALSAVGIANSVMYTMIFVFTAFNTGAVAMISRNFGEKKMDRATDIAHVNLTINIFIGIGVTIIAYALKGVFFSPYAITDAVREQLYLYYDIILMGIVFQFFNFAFASTSRGVSDTKTPMYVTGIANITNIIFNYIFIKGIWFIPAMGVGGAALGTTLSRLIAMGIYIVIFFSGRHTLKYTFKGLHIDREILKPLWRISFPGAIEQFMMQFAFLLAGVVITTLETDSEALFVSYLI
jgi:putative MATE family efflux protein